VHYIHQRSDHSVFTQMPTSLGMFAHESDSRIQDVREVRASDRRRDDIII
jgi:hypothetical protein